MRPKSVILQSQKKLQDLEKKNFRKKILPAYLFRYDLQNGVRKFFLNKWISRYLRLGDFKVPKNCSSQKLSINLIDKKSRKFRSPFSR